MEKSLDDSEEVAKAKAAVVCPELHGGGRSSSGSSIEERIRRSIEEHNKGPDALRMLSTTTVLQQIRFEQQMALVKFGKGFYNYSTFCARTSTTFSNSNKLNRRLSRIIDLRDSWMADLHGQDILSQLLVGVFFWSALNSDSKIIMGQLKKSRYNYRLKGLL